MEEKVEVMDGDTNGGKYSCASFQVRILGCLVGFQSFFFYVGVIEVYRICSESIILYTTTIFVDPNFNIINYFFNPKLTELR